ncbi:MAG: inositol monophosphatase [Gammaproteobacteria bacterium]|nr:inositol monophosphatase [Gammaproteobacteria bacterium]
MILDNEINIAIKAAKSSGKLLLDSKSILNKETSSSSKDVKLKADVSSESLIKEIITSSSEYPILAEESGKSQENLGDFFWVIDPLDGTANYNRGIPMCCVSIGLIHNMKPVAGVIYDLYNDDLYVGNDELKKATLNNEEIHVSNIDKINKGILITGLPHDTDYSDNALKEMLSDMQSWKKVRMIGSAALASCYVACGKGDLYKENGIYLWDIVAGAAIVSSAGGSAKISNIRDNYQVDVVFSNSRI